MVVVGDEWKIRFKFFFVHTSKANYFRLLACFPARVAFLTKAWEAKVLLSAELPFFVELFVSYIGSTGS